MLKWFLPLIAILFVLASSCSGNNAAKGSGDVVVDSGNDSNKLTVEDANNGVDAGPDAAVSDSGSRADGTVVQAYRPYKFPTSLRNI